ncbi:hypothetical protein, partial [Nocardia puris]|uniref:hypothetical protein n=1 Tax=Nocardia puris TaxID=208602 RepID=UPI001E5120BE
VSTGVPSRQRANAGLDQNPVTSSIIFREGAPSRDPQVLIIAPARASSVPVIMRPTSSPDSASRSWMPLRVRIRLTVHL